MSPLDDEPRDTAEPVRRSGADAARSPRGLAPDGLGRDTVEPPPDDGLDIEPPPLELPPPLLPEGRETAEPLLLPLGFGRAPDWARAGTAIASAAAVKTDVKARRLITAPMVT